MTVRFLSRLAIIGALGAILAVPASVFAADATSSASPEGNLTCWTQDACTIDADKNGTPDGRFDATSTQAVKTCGGGTYGYCYAPYQNFSLGVSLLGPGTGGVVTSAAGLGDYINKIYIFLLSFSVIVSVIMIMVGGTQYVLSAGSGNIQKAKDRIMNAIIGLVLLMFSTTILFTVNPHLVSLELPQIPRVRQVVFYPDTTSCEYFLNVHNFDGSNPLNKTDQHPGVTKGYKVDPDISSQATTCGYLQSSGTKDSSGQLLTRSKVIEDPTGADISAQNMTCRWTKCASTDNVNNVSFPQGCVEISNKDQCVSCSLSSSVPPSDGLCTQLSPRSGSLNNQYAQCVYTTDVNIVKVSSALSGACVPIAFDCGQIQSCSSYDSVITAPGWLYNGYLDNMITTSSLDYSLHKSICENDPCGKGPCHQEISSATLDAAGATLLVTAAPATLAPGSPAWAAWVAAETAVSAAVNCVSTASP